MSRAAALGTRARGEEGGNILSVPMILGMVLVGLFAFAALVMLMSYDDELRPDGADLATANDPSAVGYKGLQVLLEELGHEVRVDPYPHRGAWNGRDLRLYFPTPAFSDKRAERIAPGAPGLFILPKWEVFPVAQGQTDVVRLRDPGLSYAAGPILDTLSPNHLLKVYNAVQVEWRVPDLPGTQTISYPRWIDHRPPGAEDDEAGEGAEEDDSSRDSEEDEASDEDEELSQFERDMRELRKRFERSRSQQLVDILPVMDVRSLVLHPLDESELLVLSEPDLLSNHGIATQDRARAAVVLLSEVARHFDIEDPVFVFDDNLRRRDVSQNLIKILTRPPFLAATLCLLAAGGLVGWQGFNRFGDAAHEGEDEADAARNGPRALAETAAGFIDGAGRAGGLAPRYADVVRRQATEQLGFSVWDRARADAAIASREAVREIAPTFAQITADTTLSPMARAAKLRRWKEDITR